MTIKLSIADKKRLRELQGRCDYVRDFIRDSLEHGLHHAPTDKSPGNTIEVLEGAIYELDTSIADVIDLLHELEI